MTPRPLSSRSSLMIVALKAQKRREATEEKCKKRHDITVSVCQWSVSVGSLPSNPLGENSAVMITNYIHSIWYSVKVQMQPRPLKYRRPTSKSIDSKDVVWYGVSNE